MKIVQGLLKIKEVLYKMRHLKKKRPGFKTWTIHGHGLGNFGKIVQYFKTWEDMENKKEITIIHSIAFCINKYAHTAFPKS
jgi:hypothetical protein